LLGLSGRAKGLVRALQDRRAMVWATAGAFVGPFLGVGMSLLAVQYVETGIAASLIATTPILVIPFAWYAGDRPSMLSVVGTFVAVYGVTRLFAD
ncbi:MAG: EamA family transporter, partial [Myxococcota bacterium]